MTEIYTKIHPLDLCELLNSLPSLTEVNICKGIPDDFIEIQGKKYIQTVDVPATTKKLSAPANG